MKHYKGKGEHSVHELEELCLQQQETIARLTNDNLDLKQEIRELRQKEGGLVIALAKIQAWELPSTGKFYDHNKPVSYGVEHGSNGERDYIKSVASKALNAYSNKTSSAV